MTKRVALLLALLSLSGHPAFSNTECSGNPADLLILGDSQNGATWATAYFGNFFQGCLSKTPVRFVSYARGGTQPVHWIDSGALDRIDTVFRSSEDAGKNLGASKLPACKKRLKTLIEIHQPKKVLLFFGDNLLTARTETVRTQYRQMIGILKDAGIEGENCILVTPTYEMTVATKRNVPAKNLENTRKVTEAIRAETEGKCRIIDGLEVMRKSPLFEDDRLRRVGVPGTSGCFGAASNDNTHYCGAAAKDFAEKVCEEVGI